MRKKGLTIIELLIVITLLVLLLVAAIIFAPTQIKKGRDARRKADLDVLKIALYDYYFDHDCFPEELPGCGERFGSEGEPYLASIPCDFDDQPYRYLTRQGGGKCKLWFRIFTNLEITSDPDIDKVRCRAGCGPKNECIYNYGVASTNTQIYRNCSDAYVCAPGGGCLRFEDPWMSGCPIAFGEDDSCDGKCDDPANRCQNSSGKQVPQE